MAFDKDKALAAAQKFVDKSQYEKAIKEYLKVIEAEPNDSRTLLQLASCYEKTGKNNEDAGRTYEKVAQCYREQGAYQKALAVLKQAQRYLAEDDEIAMSMAELYSALGLPHEAVNQLEKSLARCEQSNNRRAYSKVLQTMVRVDSENIQTRTRYAKMLKEDGDIDGAVRQYKLALAQLLSKERYVDYIQTSREYLKLEPKDEEVLQELAQIYIRMERYNEAVVIMSELSFADRSSDVRELFVTCYMKLRRYKEAVEELKALARYYEELGDRPDMAESVWQRVKKIAPNDPDACMALGDEPPLLSESALNVVSPGIEREKEEARLAAQQAAVASEMERMLSMKFSQAMEAYRQGNIDEVLAICHQIVDCNEQHMPALRLMSQLYENKGDNVAMAQVERKLAKAVYENDPDEAVMHILKAERCTPRAWENFNLMLVFGFEPQKYGMSPPEMGRPSVSGQRMSVAGMSAVPASGSTAQRPAVPGASTPASACTSQRPAVPAAGMMPPRPAAPPPPVPRPSAAGLPPVSRGTRRTMDIPESVPGVPSHAMGNMHAPSYPQSVPRASVPGIAAVPPARPSAAPMPPRRMVSGAVPAVPSAVPASPAMMPPAVPASPAMMPPAAPAVPAVAPMMPPAGARRPHVPTGGNMAGPMVQSFNIPAQGRASVAASDNMDGDLSDLGSAVCDELDDVFDFLVRTPGEALKAVSPMDNADGGAGGGMPLMSSTPTQTGWKAAPGAVSQTLQAVNRVPAVQAESMSMGEGMTATPRAQVPVPSAGIGQRPMAGPSGIHSSVPSAPRASLGVPAASTANLPPSMQRREPAPVAPVQGGMVMPSVPMASVPVPSAAPAGIPDSERAQVLEALQEVDFYASLCLMDDAQRMLQQLIDKYGDVDVIHDAKVKLGC